MQSPRIDMLADSHALRVGEVRIAAGSSEAFGEFGGTAALLFDNGEGRVSISGCSHAVRPGAVELVCPGEPCTISATTSLHAYLVVAKGQS